MRLLLLLLITILPAAAETQREIPEVFLRPNESSFGGVTLSIRLFPKSKYQSHSIGLLITVRGDEATLSTCPSISVNLWNDHAFLAALAVRLDNPSRVPPAILKLLEPGDHFAYFELADQLLQESSVSFRTENLNAVARLREWIQTIDDQNSTDEIPETGKIPGK